MWVKLDSENYYADCYMEGDPDINPFGEDVNTAYITLPPELGKGKNKCYKLIINTEGVYEWKFDEAKYQGIFANTLEGKTKEMGNMLVDLQNVIITLTMGDLGV